jgi:hypothetical protein
VERRAGGRHVGARIAAILIAVLAAGCARMSPSGVEPTPTYIPQPTPDPTMAEVIRGHASPVAYLPPLEIRGSPTPVPAAGRPGPAPSGNPSGNPSAKPAAKPSATTREAAPAPKPAPTSAAVRPAPTATRAANAANAANGASGTGAPNAAPAIINPTTVLPGGPVRPNATPAR